MRWLMIWAALVPAMARADVLVATRTLPAHAVLTAGDVAVSGKAAEGAAESLAQVQGLELRTALYRGQPVLLANLGRAAAVERNQSVTILYDAGTVTISAEGRALDRGGIGDRIRVMNSDSRTTVAGIVAPGGIVRVGPDN